MAQVPIIRMAILNAAETRWPEVGARLRGSALLIGVKAVDSCDAAIVFDAPADPQAIERMLQAGKHVLLTPDTGLAAERLRALAEVAKNGNVRFGLANPDRYLPSRQLIRQQLDAGKLGTPGLLRIHRWESAGTPVALLRDLDLALWYFGKMPTNVYAIEQAACAAVHVHLGFPGGGMALIDHVRQLPTGDGYYSLSLIGASGAAYADDHANMQLVYRGDAPRAVHAGEGVVPLVALAQDFVDAVAAGRDLSASLDEWCNAIAIGHVVTQSLATKQAIALG
jgi:predicted dehydrogenase